MEFIHDIPILLLILFGGTYSLLIILFTVGWFRLKNENYPDYKGMISVLISVRNEAQSIRFLLEDLKKQSISTDEFEVLIIDDHSEDESAHIISEFCNRNPGMPFQLIKNKKNGKKEAIALGISQAKGEIILCVDADCRVGSEWISSIRSAFGNSVVQMISGPVTFFKENSLFKNIQSLEFLSLIASGAGAIGMKIPFMCNGANLAFRKTAFADVNGYTGNNQFASGDDVFLLHKIKKHYGSEAICFLKDRNAIVETASSNTLKSFLQQRKRWASKSRAYKDIFTLFTSITVAGFSLVLILLLVLSFYNNRFLAFFVMGLMLKIKIDFALLMATSCFLHKRYLMWYYLPVQLIYPIYTILISLLAFFTKNEWKGREIN